MRSYENSGYNPYNENSRSQSRSSARNYYSDENDLTNRMQRAHGSNSRGGTLGMGSGRDSSSTSGYGGTSSYGRSAGSSNYGSGYGSSDSNRYGSSNYGSSNSRYNNDNDSNRYGRDNDNWSRSGDSSLENTWERTKDRVSNAWNNMTDDNDRDSSYRGSSQNRGSYGNSGSSYGSYGAGMGIGSSYGTSNNYGSGSSYGSSGSGSNYGSGYGSSDSNRYGSGSGSYGSSNYGSGSGSDYGSSNYGSGSYGNSNYGSGSSYGRSSDRDRYPNNDRGDNDRGFFDRAGDEVRSWFGDDEAERRRRMDEMRDRGQDNDYNRYGSSYSQGTTNSGPPYSYGSSSRRDYEW